jgi:Holliday junction DNA helicase RuvA
LIGRLSGRVVEEAADGTIVLDVAGVGYEVVVPLGTLGRARALPAQPPVHEGAAARPLPPSDALTLFIHTHVREDALLLYGFATREDRATFRALISISNIGPKIGLAILSALPAAELAAVIVRKDVSKLTNIPGVGKKTAERLVLELKDKLIELPTPAAPAAAPPPPAPSAKGDLLRGALTGMGYRPAEADRALTTLGERVEAAPLDDLVREALAVLSR